MVTTPNSSSAVASAPPVGVVQGEGREPGQVIFEEALVGFFVDAADLLGVPKSVAIIYGIVFASPQPVRTGTGRPVHHLLDSIFLKLT